MFLSNNGTSFHLWWKDNLVKHQKVSRCYENDCRLHKFSRRTSAAWSKKSFQSVREQSEAVRWKRVFPFQLRTWHIIWAWLYDENSPNWGKPIAEHRLRSEAKNKSKRAGLNIRVQDQGRKINNLTKVIWDSKFCNRAYQICQLNLNRLTSPYDGRWSL